MCKEFRCAFCLSESHETRMCTAQLNRAFLLRSHNTNEESQQGNANENQEIVILEINYLWHLVSNDSSYLHSLEIDQTAKWILMCMSQVSSTDERWGSKLCIYIKYLLELYDFTIRGRAVDILTTFQLTCAPLVRFELKEFVLTKRHIRFYI